MALMTEAIAETITYTYAGDEYCVWGTSKANETYDVAMRIDNSAFVGKKITSVSATIYAASGVSATSIWLSKELTLDKKVNVPDIMSIPVTLDNRGEMNATLPAPYTITEDGVYVGYSFTVDELNDYTASPLLLSTAVNENGFYLHTSRTVLKWKNYGVESLPATAVIKVTIEGDFPENALEVKSMDTVYGQAGLTGTARIEVENKGTETVKEIGYTYTIGNLTKTATATLSTPIVSDLFHSATPRLTFDLPEEVGEYSIDVTVDKINGKDNSAVAKTVSAKLYTVSEVPVHKPVLEEYTGTWCGYCPRGWFALEKMKKLYGEDFIAIAYHKRDPMAVIPVEDFPTYVDGYGYPAATLDRGRIIDPYYGYYENYAEKVPFGIETEWQEACMAFSPAFITLSARWTDDKLTGIEANSSVGFVLEEKDVDYRLSYVLCADDLHSTDPRWNQENYYPEEAADFVGTELYQLSEWPEKINDLHFNEVVLASNNLLGMEGILPRNTKPGETTKDNHTFAVTDDIAPLIQNPEKLFVVAMVIDGKTGRIVNAAKAHVTYEAGIDDVTCHEAADIISVCYTDLLGRTVKSPAGGIYVRTVRYSDGTVKSEKVSVK